MQKLYCYADETGQDTKGSFFLVAVLLAKQSAVSQLEKELEEIEKESRKKALSWNDTSFARRQAYLKRVLRLTMLKESVFYGTWRDTKDYTTLTAQAITESIRLKAVPPYQVSIFIDGLKDTERDQVRRLLRRSGIRYRSVRGLRDESSSLIRLCDAFAGLLRDHEEGEPWAQSLVSRFEQLKVVKKL